MRPRPPASSSDALDEPELDEPELEEPAPELEAVDEAPEDDVSDVRDDDELRLDDRCWGNSSS